MKLIGKSKRATRTETKTKTETKKPDEPEMQADVAIRLRTEGSTASERIEKKIERLTDEGKSVAVYAGKKWLCIVRPRKEKKNVRRTRGGYRAID
jgi:hypothetical protein